MTVYVNEPVLANLVLEKVADMVVLSDAKKNLDTARHYGLCDQSALAAPSGAHKILTYFRGLCQTRKLLLGRLARLIQVFVIFKTCGADIIIYLEGEYSVSPASSIRCGIPRSVRVR